MSYTSIYTVCVHTCAYLVIHAWDKVLIFYSDIYGSKKKKGWGRFLAKVFASGRYILERQNPKYSHEILYIYTVYIRIYNKVFKVEPGKAGIYERTEFMVVFLWRRFYRWRSIKISIFKTKRDRQSSISLCFPIISKRFVLHF